MPDIDVVARNTLSDMAGTIEGSIISALPPNSGGQWTSSAYQFLGVDPGPCHRYPIISNTQEPSVFYGSNVSTIYMTCTSGASYTVLYSCVGDPTVASNWSLVGTIVGGGTKGIAGGAAHSWAYLEAGTVYLYFVDTTNNNVRLISCPLANITTLADWSLDATTIVPLSAITGAYALGNVCVVKVGSTYAMYLEYIGPITWQMALFTSANKSGLFSLVTNPITTLLPGGYTGSSQSGGPWVSLDADGVTWVMLYHGTPGIDVTYGGLLWPSVLYRATTTTPLTDSWIIDNQGLPIVRCASAVEIDQIADPFIFTTSSGVKYLFVEGGCNLNGQNAWYMECIPMLPKLVQNDGFSWKLAQPGHDPMPPVARIQTFEDRFQSCLASLYPQGSTLGSITPVGTWTYDATTSGQPMPRSYSDGSSGDCISFPVRLSPGSWILNILCDTGPAQGEINIVLNSYPVSSFSGLNIAPTPIETYSGSTVQGVSKTLSFTIGANWSESTPSFMTFFMLHKNASSSGYGLSWYGWSLSKTTP